MRGVLACAVVAAGLAACGEDDGQRPAERTAEPTAAATPAPASSAQECTDLWNEQARLGTAGQKSATDYLTEAAAHDPRVFVAFENGECLVLARLPRNRAYVFVAAGGRLPFGHPSQVELPKGRRLRHNGRATDEGRIEPG